MVSGISSGKAFRGGGCGVPSISMDSPPWSFSFAFAGCPLRRTCPCSMSSCTRARLMSGIACARYWSSRRPAASGAAIKAWTWSSASSSTSSWGITGGGDGSTPRVARYSCFTVWRRLPFGSMYLDGMSGLASRLLPDECGDDDHRERDPLNRIEHTADCALGVFRGSNKSEQKLGKAAEHEHEYEGISYV